MREQAAWTEREFWERFARRKDPRGDALAWWIVIVLAAPVLAALAMLVIAERIPTWIAERVPEWVGPAIVCVYAVAAVGATVHVVFTYRIAPPRAELRCPRCGADLKKPWRQDAAWRHLIRQYLQRRLAGVTRILRLRCPSCELLLAETRGWPPKP